MGLDRLFVNLTTPSWNDFDVGYKGVKKRYEFRRVTPVYNRQRVYRGRQVELRNAWSRGSLWGTVGEVMTGTIDEIFAVVNSAEVEPRFPTREEAMVEERRSVGKAPDYICFEVCDIRRSR